MVREAEKRQRKFEAKVDAEVLSRQTTALKPLMVKGQRAYFPQIASLEQRIKTLVEAKGVKTLEVRDYLNYGREILDLSKRFSGTTLQAEAQLKTDKWSARGLDGFTLKEVAMLVGVNVTSLETINCLFDFMRIGAYYPSLALSTYFWSSLYSNDNLFRAGIYPLSRTVRFDKVAVYIITGTINGKIRLAIYDSDLLRKPTSLVKDFGEFSASSTGWIEGAIDITLKKGLYFVCWNTNNYNIGLRISTHALKILGAVEVLTDYTRTQSLGSFYTSLTYGPFPQTAPSVGLESSYLPLIYFRLKELP